MDWILFWTLLAQVALAALLLALPVGFLIRVVRVALVRPRVSGSYESIYSSVGDDE